LLCDPRASVATQVEHGGEAGQQTRGNGLRQ
jgi:hypothetical protein